jgi:hypothetical protein
MQASCPSCHPVQQEIHLDQIHHPRVIKITKSVNNLCQRNNSHENNVIMYLNHNGFQFLGSFVNELLAFTVPRKQIGPFDLENEHQLQTCTCQNIGTM